VKLLVVNPVTPRRDHGINAAPVVIFELIAALKALSGGPVGFLKLIAPGEKQADAQDAAGLAALAALGVDVLPPFNLSTPRARRSSWRAILAPGLADFYPDVASAPQLLRHVTGYAPDVVLVPWSESATALCAELPAVRFAYYGNADPKNWRIRTDLARRAGGSLPNYLANRALGARLEPLHLEVMRRYAVLGDVAANDAEYYRDKGHPNAFYLQNLWIDRFGGDWMSRRTDANGSGPAIIIANVGKLFGTANTLGLELLGRDLLPELRRSMGRRAFELHLLGSGQPHPLVADLLSAPEIRLRGFVADIDAEMLAAPIFLCMNNASVYKVGHTRYLHAWSLGGCVVAHADAALSMPEMRHEQNCLLGGSAAEIADLVARAAADAGLRRRLGEAGYATFRDTFTAASVAPLILERLATPPPNGPR